MNLYSNINSFSNFSGWGSSSGSILDSSGWVPVSTPKVSDYVPSYTPAAPSAADYIRTQPVTEPSVTRPTSLEPIPVTETSLSGSRHYSVEELQQIGSGSKEEVVEFFKNIGGDVKTVIDEDGISSQNYSSPLLDGKEFIVTERGKSYWQTGHGALFENGKMIREALSSASPTVSLTDSEIAAIINAQNNLPPQAEDYIPVETAPAAEGGNTELPANPLTETAAVLRPDIVPAVPQPPAAVPAENTTVENTAPAADSAQTQNPQSPAAEDRPQPDQAASTAVNDTATLVSGAADGIHRQLMEEADKLKNTVSIKHDLQSGVSHMIMAFEEGEIADERRAYYAQNREALNEAVEKMRANTAELNRQYGETAGKAYAVGMAGKIIGGVSTVADTLELGKRIGAAADSGDWSPVVGQITKIVGSAAAGAASMGLVRTGGLILAGAIGGTGAAAIIGTAIAGAAIGYVISEAFDVMEEYISESGAYNLSKILDKENESYEDLAIIGNFQSSESVKLSAQNNLTIIGNQHFKDVQLEGQDISVVGSISADANLVFNGDSIQFHNDAAVSAILAPKEDNPVEQPPVQQTDNTQAEANTINEAEIREALGLMPEQYLNLEYLGEAAAREGKNPTEYALNIRALAEELVHGQEFYDEYDGEWEQITGTLPVPDPQAELDTGAAYRAAPPPVNPLPNDYEMPLM